MDKLESYSNWKDR